jgi:hypothetical protein
MFWGGDFEKFYHDNYANFVIGRGDVEDVRQCRRCYGGDKVREALTQAKWMRKDIVYFAMAVLGNKIEGYKCYPFGLLPRRRVRYKNQYETSVMSYNA